jgi:hypothetical protein
MSFFFFMKVYELEGADLTLLKEIEVGYVGLSTMLLCAV